MPTFLESLDCTVESLAQCYQELIGEELPQQWLALALKFPLLSGMVMEYLNSGGGDFAIFGKLNLLHYMVRGYPLGGEPPAAASPGLAGATVVKSKATRKLQQLTIKDVVINVPMTPDLVAPVCYARPEELWPEPDKKPEMAVMFKLFGFHGQPLPLEMIEQLIDAFQAKPKAVADHIRWTLSGKYSQYGWAGATDGKAIMVQPIGWDATSMPPGAVSFTDYRLFGKRVLAEQA